MKDTKIEWCDHSWSPWRGCTKVSPGCANCYAETLSKRNPAVLGQWGKGKPRVKAKNWNEPRKWNKAWSKAQYFCRIQVQPEPTHPTVFPSLCDWLDEDVPIEWLAEFLQLIHATPNLTWLLLTKRPENWRERIDRITAHNAAAPWTERDAETRELARAWVEDGKAPDNVWVGTSVEDQTRADERIPALLKIPARGRFLSLEPLLGPVELLSIRAPFRAPLSGDELYVRDLVHWLIIGGESGNGSRPCNVEWVRSLVRQGKAAGVPTFVKQLGARPVTQHPMEAPGILIEARCSHPKGGDPAEWPEDLRVRHSPDWAPRS